MRSELVFTAGEHVSNRFLLCHLVRAASRKFHKAGDPIQSTINKVLGLVNEHAFVGPAVENDATLVASLKERRRVLAA